MERRRRRKAERGRGGRERRLGAGRERETRGREMEPTCPQHRTAHQHCTLAQSRATDTRLAREQGGSQ